jgi:hypothetical protein
VARLADELGRQQIMHRRGWAAAIIALVLVVGQPSTSLAATEATGPAIGACATPQPDALDLLPDLKMAPLYGLTIRTNGTGRKHLRFGTISWNIGDGPIEVRGENRVGDTLTLIAQRIYDTRGACRDVLQPAATMWYAGDGHNHWHVRKYMVSQLYRKTGGGIMRIKKLGFCLLDYHQADPLPANAPPDRVYWNRVCGTSTSQTIAMGISVGYADDYQPLIAQQWIDITGLPADTYRLCTGVNPFGWWLEKAGVTTNNFYWLDLRLNPTKGTFSILAHGRGFCLK